MNTEAEQGKIPIRNTFKMHLRCNNTTIIIQSKSKVINITRLIISYDTLLRVLVRRNIVDIQYKLTGDYNLKTLLDICKTSKGKVEIVSFDL